MKIKFYNALLILLLISSVPLKAQWIQSLTVVPPNPVAGSPFMVLAECSFPAGNCDAHTQYMNINGNLITAGALHCLGVLTVICNHTDTFLINPLPAGNYTFHFQIDAGFGNVPCTPGIVPGPSDTINFTVFPAVGIDEAIPQDAVRLFPNPPDDYFMIRGVETSDFPVTIAVFSPEGKLVKNELIKNADEGIPSGDLPVGMYQVQLQLKDGQRFLIPLLKK